MTRIIDLKQQGNPFSDAPEWGEDIIVLQPSTGDVLSTHKVSNAPSPSGAGPVEAFFVPGVQPALVYIPTWRAASGSPSGSQTPRNSPFRKEFRFDELG